MGMTRRLAIGCGVLILIVLALLAYLFLIVPARPVAAAPPLSVVASGRTARISWEQPEGADTAIVMRERQPQLVEALKLIAGPQSVQDDETQAGDVYWIDFWDDADPVGTMGPTGVRWEMRLIVP